MDDQRAVLQLAQRLLEGAGYPTIAELSPTDALGRLAVTEPAPRLLLVDVEMLGR